MPTLAPPSFDRRSKPHPLQMPHAVRRQKHPGADFAERGRLLVDGDIEAVGDQRIRGEQAANSASDDDDLEPLSRCIISLDPLNGNSGESASKELRKPAGFKLSFPARNTKRRRRQR